MRYAIKKFYFFYFNFNKILSLKNQQLEMCLIYQVNKCANHIRLHTSQKSHVNKCHHIIDIVDLDVVVFLFLFFFFLIYLFMLFI